jgi:hypothetical protein
LRDLLTKIPSQLSYLNRKPTQTTLSTQNWEENDKEFSIETRK